LPNNFKEIFRNGFRKIDPFQKSRKIPFDDKVTIFWKSVFVSIFFQEIEQMAENFGLNLNLNVNFNFVDQIGQKLNLLQCTI
jgi:hypothetical protein